MRSQGFDMGVYIDKMALSVGFAAARANRIRSYTKQSSPLRSKGKLRF